MRQIYETDLSVGKRHFPAVETNSGVIIWPAARLAVGLARSLKAVFNRYRCRSSWAIPITGQKALQYRKMSVLSKL